MAVCYNDGSIIPTLHRWRDATGTDWFLTWCDYCNVGFLSADAPDHGRECCASVAWHDDRQEWALLTKYGTAAGHVASLQLLDRLPPLPVALESAYFEPDPRQKELDEKERMVWQLFARIERDGWTCTHCGRQGVAREDFRLSTGPPSYVICRKCGFVQEPSQES